ncbi:MAG TPA: 1-aminocyclopropane-1-carboxylate deaminase/D-cysteine desulfhydrase [Campylobacterales bacterium]|nr:1-aminocyclopropane-1-carboxylate deaminase/D-cysteine desulfhydrase [Campylobacterales bacterium]
MEIRKSPLHKITFRNTNFLLKRDDLLDSRFSGNKARKLHYFLNYDFNNFRKIISHGSPQSNAMYSLSELSKIKGVGFEYYVDHIADYLKQNPHGNYKYALQNGMKILEEAFPITLKDEELFIPEGGHFVEAEYGIKILAQELKLYDADIFLPSGTGTTALYLQKHLKQKVYTCACVGGANYLKKQFLELEGDERRHPTILTLDKKYHFAKLYREFFEIWIELKKETDIEFDLLYDPLGWMTLLKYQPQFKKEILYIHQGGLIGNESMYPRYKRRFNEDYR